MTNEIILQVLEKFFKEEVADHIKLKKPESDEYVNPNVFIGYLPPKGFLPEGFDLPCIVVGMMDGNDSDTETTLSARITFAIYSEGHEENGEIVPDMQGYKDIVSLIDKSRLKLATNSIIGGVCTVNKPITWALYDEQPWPFWYGYIAFTCNTYMLQHELI